MCPPMTPRRSGTTQSGEMLRRMSSSNRCSGANRGGPRTPPRPSAPQVLHLALPLRPDFPRLAFTRVDPTEETVPLQGLTAVPPRTGRRSRGDELQHQTVWVSQRDHLGGVWAVRRTPWRVLRPAPRQPLNVAHPFLRGVQPRDNHAVGPLCPPVLIAVATTSTLPAACGTANRWRLQGEPTPHSQCSAVPRSLTGARRARVGRSCHGADVLAHTYPNPRLVDRESLAMPPSAALHGEHERSGRPTETIR
jgi:hypothetical protein